MYLDLRGQECPVPTIKTVEAIKRLKENREGVVVVVDDATCAADIPFQAGQLGYVATREETGASEWTIRLEPGIRRGGGAAVADKADKMTQDELREATN